MTGHRHDAGQGAVVVDIGDDVGALVLYTDADMADAEIEISPVDDDMRRSHVAVHARPVRGHGSVHAAVYPALTRGSYQLWRPDGRRAGTVHVEAGRVTETTWGSLLTGG